MTIIVVKGDTIAADSATYCDTLYIGDGAKILPVPYHFGGGFVAGWGDANICDIQMASMTDTGKLNADIKGNCGLVWLNKDGYVYTTFTDTDWVKACSAEFHTYGAGDVFAAGAMRHGATPKEAVAICIKYEKSCGGSIQVESLQ